jgi:hypothetical protein
MNLKDLSVPKKILLLIAGAAVIVLADLGVIMLARAFGA